MAVPTINNTDAYPLELQYIKALFLQSRYRQCISACRDILENASAEHNEESPIRQTFISFYMGLAHEELARLMHDYSSAKLPAFRQAEQFYHEAINSLPHLSAITSSDDGTSPLQDVEDPFTDVQPIHSSPPPSNDYDPFNYSTPSFPDLSSSPPPRINSNDELPTRSPQTSSHETSSSDLESHSSFDKIMTPHKVLLEREASRMSLLDEVKAGALERDVSRMSLLDAAQPQGLARGVSRLSLLDSAQQPTLKPSLPRSTSQGLMKPSRLGSPPKAFHVPPRLPYTGSSASTSRLPRLCTWSSPARRLPSSIEEEREWEDDPPSPVSPLKYGDTASDDSPLTVSPISPQTPIRSSTADYQTAHELHFQSPDTQDSAIGEPLPHPSQLAKQHHIEEHLHSLHTQLETHLRLLSRAREATLAAQSKRQSMRAATAPLTGDPFSVYRAPLDSSRPTSADSKHDSLLGPSRTIGDGTTKLSRERSFWSFTLVDVKAKERSERVQEGRERVWVRERFDAERYQVLAERALAEL